MLQSILIGLPIDHSRPRNEWGKKGSGYKPHFTVRKALESERRLMDAQGAEPIIYTGDSHLLTVGPTGAGKGRSVIIPNLLTYPGPIVVFDPKGENYAVTSRRRKELGHKVIKLDPFGVTEGQSDGFNPFDVFQIPKSGLESDAQMLGDLLSKNNVGQKEPFWDISATGLCSGLIAHIASDVNEGLKDLGAVWDLLCSDDVAYNLAVLLDSMGKKMNKMAYREISMFLQLPEQQTRPSVLGTATTYLRILSSPEVRDVLSHSSFSIDDIITGKPISIYIVIPPDKLQSHAALLKLWVGALFRAITSRQKIPKSRTLFILDECAQLGRFPYLESVVTLCRGYGLQVWTFWQDIGQIKQNYSTGWATMINNCDVLQIFGPRNHMVAGEFAEITGTSADEIRQIDLDQQVVVIRGGDPLRSTRFDYLADDLFKGQHDQNPLYSEE